MPHSCQVRTASAALFCLYSTVVFTDQPRALQLFSAAVSPHTERCAGWLAAPVRTRAFIGRFAHSNVASLNTSSHGSQLMTQAVDHLRMSLKTPLPADYFDRSIICSCCDTHAATGACPVPFGMRLIRPRASSRCSCAKAAGSGLAADITSDRLHLFLR